MVGGLGQVVGLESGLQSSGRKARALTRMGKVSPGELGWCGREC